MKEPKPSSKISPTPDWREILLIRHGATALNSNDHTVDRIRGWQDWPLSENGKKEAVNLTGKLVGFPDVLLCSNLTRARQTAEIIADYLGLENSDAQAAFLPWDVGCFVGARSVDAIPRLAAYSTRWPYKQVPGGEAFATFRVRLFRGLLAALQKYSGLVGIVTHHRCERLIKAWAKAEYPEDGSFDQEEFTRKGEPTGHCEIIKIPVHRLELWEQWLVLQRPHRFHDSDLDRITAEHA